MGSYSSSYSSSVQNTHTRISSSNVQGNEGDVFGQDSVTALATDSNAIHGSSNEIAGRTTGEFAHVLGRGASLNQSDNSSTTIYNANGVELAQIAADVSIAALEGYQKVNERSLQLAEKAANEVIEYKAEIEAEVSKSEEVKLSENYLKWGAGLTVAYLIYKKVK